MTNAFELIPVVDLMAGRVVRAVGGDRANYRPLISRLSPDASPLEAVRGFLTLAPFARVYLADLDGIEGGAVQHQVLAEIEAAFPDIEVWVDAGLADEAACRDWQARHRARIVLGSESLRDTGLAVRLACVLSLDFRGAEFLGHPALFADSRLWPRDVIAMTLDRVGEGGGPNTGLVAKLIARGGAGRRIHAAGGVRGDADVSALTAMGASGALVASALHDGALTTPLRPFPPTPHPSRI